MFLAAGWVFALTFYVGLLRFNYPSKKKFPVLGIDVSHHQGVIDWHKAKKDGVQFAYIKATEGGDFKDPRFLDNWVRSGFAEVPRGAYHFFSFCRPPLEQAKNFLATVPMEEQTLPPALDLEFGGNCGHVPTQIEMENNLNDFALGISIRYSKPLVFYVTPEVYKRYFSSPSTKFPPHRLWIRNILREPTGKPCEAWAYWQYANRGRIAGIRGPVDLNVFCGSTSQFIGTLEAPDSFPRP